MKVFSVLIIGCVLALVSARSHRNKRPTYDTDDDDGDYVQEFLRRQGIRIDNSGVGGRAFAPNGDVLSQGAGVPGKIRICRKVDNGNQFRHRFAGSGV